PQLDAWNERRRKIAATYRERLCELPIGFQSITPHEEHVYHLFQIRTKDRDALMDHLLRAGVDAAVRYPVPIHLQEAFKDCKWRAGQFPVAERLARELLCLPIRPDMTDQEIDYVCEEVSEFFCGGTAMVTGSDFRSHANFS